MWVSHVHCPFSFQFFLSLTTSASFLPVFLFSRNDLSTLLAAEEHEHPIFNLSLLHTKRG